MKFRLLILLMLLSSQLFAQRLNGLIFDKSTGLAVPGAVIKKGKFVQASYSDGSFSVPNVHFGDTIKITSLGFKPYNLFGGMTQRDTVKVYLEPNGILLNNVTVNSYRNARPDSLKNRNEFAGIFNYKSPTVKDAFLTVDPYERPDHFITSEHSTAAIVGIDLVSIASLFSDQKSHQNNLQAIALKNEEIAYVDRRFSKQKVGSVTGLHDQTLDDFMADYRPTVAAMKSMTDYDLIVYIKKSYADFSRKGR